MNRPRFTTATCCIALLAFGVEAQVVVIAHPSVPLETLNKADLIDYYTGDLNRWPDDSDVVILDLKPKNDVKRAFYDFLGKRPSRLKSIWMKRMLSGEGDPPEAMKTESEIVDKVASTPGALSYVSKVKVTELVKTLLVIPETE